MQQHLELSRKERDRIPRNSKIEAALDEAAHIMAFQFCANAEYGEKLHQALDLSGRQLLSLVREDEEVFLIVPIWVSKDDMSGTELGMLLALEDRAIVSWTQGTFKIKYFAQSIPYWGVNAISQKPADGDNGTIVLLDAVEKWILLIPNMFDAQTIGEAVVSYLSGKES